MKGRSTDDSKRARDDVVEEEFFSEPRIKCDDRDERTDPRGEATRELVERAFVRARRARFARYVKGATCVAALICAAALVQTLTSVSSPPAAAVAAVSVPVGPGG